MLRFAGRLGLERYSIGGSSFGGLICSLMWFARPERIDTVAIIGAGSVFHDPQELREILKQVFANASKALGNPTLETCRARLAHIMHPSVEVPADILLTQLTSYALPDRFDAYKATIGGMRDALGSPEHQAYHRLEEMKVPCLVITGRDDIRVSLEATEARDDAVARCRASRLRSVRPPAVHGTSGTLHETMLAFLDKHRERLGR